MRLQHKATIAAMLFAFTITIFGCQQEGAAEKAGKKIDKAVENIEKKAE